LKASVAVESSAEPYRDSILIEAAPAIVFDYFTDARALASWMGDDAFVEPFPGGRFTIFFGPRAVEGWYVAVEPPRRLVITWGWAGDPDFAPGTSTLEVTLVAERGGTRVSIVHSGLPDKERERHREGWRHYLPRLAEVVIRGV
jgi:uncharacterized protein YndB with AHSA1/START domain